MTARYHKRKIKIFLILGLLLVAAVLFYNYARQQETAPKIRGEFKIRGLTWRTISYYYHPGIYKEMYNRESNIRLIKKAKNAGANYLLIRVFYSGTENGGLVGNDTEAGRRLREAIATAHSQKIKIFLTPYVESRDYWDKKWVLSEKIWSDTVLKWAEFAEENNVEMFAPGVEMNLIFEEDASGEWLKTILPRIREVYNGKIVTAEHYDIERWKILDERDAFDGYDCIGLTFFPRKEYEGVSDIRSFDDYAAYMEEEAETIDMLSEKYNISCKLAVPMGLDYWKGSHLSNPVPDAAIVARATDMGLDILAKHNFTGVFVSHWASEPDHFGTRKDVEITLKKHWVETE